MTMNVAAVIATMRCVRSPTGLRCRSRSYPMIPPSTAPTAMRDTISTWPINVTPRRSPRGAAQRRAKQAERQCGRDELRDDELLHRRLEDRRVEVPHRRREPIERHADERDHQDPRV